MIDNVEALIAEARKAAEVEAGNRWPYTSPSPYESLDFSQRDVDARAAKAFIEGVVFQVRRSPEPPDSGEAVTYKRRFHEHYPGTEPLWHTYCKEHPEFGTCADEATADRDIRDHRVKKHKNSPEPTLRALSPVPDTEGSEK